MIFKKYLYLRKDIEIVDYSIDLVRLDLITSQIFREVFEITYILSYNDYCLIAALRAYLLYGGITEVKANDFLHVMEEKSLKESIPDEVFYKKEKEFWVDIVGDNWKSFSEGILKISNVNKQLNLETNSAMLKSFERGKAPINYISAINNVKKNLKPTECKTIAKFLTIESISNSALYGFRCFWVNYEGPLKKKSKDFGWLAISFEKISLLNIKKIETNKVLYEDITDYRTYPDSFELVFIGRLEDARRQTRSMKFMSFHEGMGKIDEDVVKSKEDPLERREKVNMRFYTGNSLEIFQLIECYRALRKESEEKKWSLLG